MPFRDSPILSLTDIEAIMDWEMRHIVPFAQMDPRSQETYKYIMRELCLRRISGNKLDGDFIFNDAPLEIFIDKQVQERDNNIKEVEKEPKG